MNSPDPVTDRGKYFCKAKNAFGSIRSRSVSIAFGFIGEFILRRSNEVGSENWGKAISCDPPQYFPDVKFYWARDYFPNFVEEDRRVMVNNTLYLVVEIPNHPNHIFFASKLTLFDHFQVSYDGYIYFSALEKIDRGNYSCSVQSSVSNQVVKETTSINYKRCN